jgi:hypothetical protein
MKHLLFLILLTFAANSTVLSQNMNHALYQNNNHPSIDRVSVVYKDVSAAPNTPAGGAPNAQVSPDISVSLKTSASVATIYCKILDVATGAVLYQVSYALSSPAITDLQGVKLFYVNAQTIHIGCPQVLPLKPYHYQLYTQDAQGEATTIFSIIQ